MAAPARVVFRKIHKWIALVVGVQVLLWTLSGFVMSFFPIEKVRGEHRMTEPDERPLRFEDVRVSMDELPAAGEIRELRLGRLLDRQVYRLTLTDGEVRLVDASTGEVLSPLSRETAEAVARAGYAGDAPTASVELLRENNTEYRKAVPVWQVILDDDEGTRIYVSPLTGEITARRSSLWRFYDFFWMLHIMDYDERSDFNHPLLIVASILGVAVSITGVVLLFATFRRRHLRQDARFFRRLLGRSAE